MKMQFINKKFSKTSETIIEQANEILNRYRAMGYKLTVRQLYYQFIQLDILPDSWRDMKTTKSKNNVSSYKKLGDIISDARLAGRMDWSMIEDRGRDAFLPAAWSSPADIVEAAARQFRVDRWEGQRAYVEVMVEKDALSGVLERVCSELHVRLTANKGYSSSTAMFDAGRRINDVLLNGASAAVAHIFYLGDTTRQVLI